MNMIIDYPVEQLLNNILEEYEVTFLGIPPLYSWGEAMLPPAEWGKSLLLIIGNDLG